MKKIFCGTLALLLVLVALGILPGMTPVRPPSERFSVSLDGIMAGWLHSAEGGHATSDVVSEKVGPDHIVHKHLAGVKYEDITLQAGFGMSKNFYEWIKASFDHKHIRKDGSIHTADYDGNITQTMNFYHALITEIGMPALDASSKEPAYLTLKLQPEITRVGGAANVPPPPRPKKRHLFLPSNFRLEIDGVDCSGVAKIDAITLKQKVQENPVGEVRDPNLDAADQDISNLKITIATDSSDSWKMWFNDFVILGMNTDDREKAGTLFFLGDDGKTVLAKLRLKHLGIFGLHPPVPPKICCDNCTLLQPSPDPAGLKHLVAELYCEEIEAEFGTPTSD